jgi:hypothetical protein
MHPSLLLAHLALLLIWLFLYRLLPLRILRKIKLRPSFPRRIAIGTNGGEEECV